MACAEAQVFAKKAVDMQFLKCRLSRLPAGLGQRTKSSLTLHFDHFRRVGVEVDAHQQIGRAKVAGVIHRKETLLPDAQKTAVPGALDDLAVYGEFFITHGQQELPVATRIQIRQEPPYAKVIGVTLAYERR